MITTMNVSTTHLMVVFPADMSAVDFVENSWSAPTNPQGFNSKVSLGYRPIEG